MIVYLKRYASNYDICMKCLEYKEKVNQKGNNPIKYSSFIFYDFLMEIYRPYYTKLFMEQRCGGFP